MLKKINILNNKGLTLIELMIAMALFVTVMVVVTGLFGQAINNQSKTTAQKNLQESLDFSLNFFKKEVAGAQRSLLLTTPSTYCGGASASDRFFYTPSRTFQGRTVKDLFFINKNEQCVRYFLQQDIDGVVRLAVTRNSLPVDPYFVYLTSSDASITDLDFDFIPLDEPDYPSAKVTIFLAAKPKDGVTVETLSLQTTVALNPFVCGQSITDRDNFSYKTVLIGGQCWMAENLKTKTKPDGTCINSGVNYVAPACIRTTVAGTNCSESTGFGSLIFECGGEAQSGRDCIYYDSIVGNIRGTEADCQAGYTLYNWTALMNGSVIEGAQGICPNGWHVPSGVEINTLISLYGDYTTAGPFLKSTGSSGYNDILAGNRTTSENNFENQTLFGHYWTSTDKNPAQAYRIKISTNDAVPINYAFDQYKLSFSVRCLKD